MTKIMVVDDYAPSLNRIAKHISQLERYQVMATARDGYELLKFCYQKKTLPDIVLLDVLMPKLDGVSSMEYLNNYFPAIKVIAVSSFEMDHMVTDMLASGAWGYVFKDKGLDYLAEALHSVTNGVAYVDPRFLYDISLRESLMQKRKTERDAMFKQFGLSAREKEIIGLIVSNMDYAEIGKLLSIAPKTIENAVHTLTQKMGVTNGRSGLLIHSIRFGLAKMMNLRSGTTVKVQS
jgi:DNA-binding NarL/FixJ family response regulator